MDPHHPKPEFDPTNPNPRLQNLSPGGTRNAAASEDEASTATAVGNGGSAGMSMALALRDGGNGNGNGATGSGTGLEIARRRGCDTTGLEIVQRRPRGRPPGSKNKPKPPIYIERDDTIHPHIVEILPDHDVLPCIMSFAQRRNATALCILNGHGTVSNVRLLSPSGEQSWHGTHEIFSITGTFLPNVGQNLTVKLCVTDASRTVRGGTVVGMQSVGHVYLMVVSMSNPSYHRVGDVNAPPASSGGRGGAPHGDDSSSGGGGGGGVSHGRSQGSQGLPGVGLSVPININAPHHTQQHHQHVSGSTHGQQLSGSPQQQYQHPHVSGSPHPHGQQLSPHPQGQQLSGSPHQHPHGPQVAESPQQQHPHPHVSGSPGSPPPHPHQQHVSGSPHHQHVTVSLPQQSQRVIVPPNPQNLPGLAIFANPFARAAPPPEEFFQWHGEHRGGHHF